MSENKKECPNTFECPCANKECPNYAMCCACVNNHRNAGNLPCCFRDQNEC